MISVSFSVNLPAGLEGDVSWCESGVVRRRRHRGPDYLVAGGWGWEGLQSLPSGWRVGMGGTAVSLDPDYLVAGGWPWEGLKSL